VHGLAHYHWLEIAAGSEFSTRYGSVHKLVMSTSELDGHVHSLAAACSDGEIRQILRMRRSIGCDHVHAGGVPMSVASQLIIRDGDWPAWERDFQASAAHLRAYPVRPSCPRSSFALHVKVSRGTIYADSWESDVE